MMLLMVANMMTLLNLKDDDTVSDSKVFVAVYCQHWLKRPWLQLLMVLLIAKIMIFLHIAVGKIVTGSQLFVDVGYQHWLIEPWLLLLVVVSKLMTLIHFADSETSTDSQVFVAVGYQCQHWLLILSLLLLLQKYVLRLVLSVCAQTKHRWLWMLILHVLIGVAVNNSMAHLSCMAFQIIHNIADIFDIKILQTYLTSTLMALDAASSTF
jgi:hypothetical protein